MIPLGTSPSPTPHAEVPTPVDLPREGKIYLLSLLHYRILCGEVVDTDSWRDAWGQAADYQTVVNARRELAGLSR